MVVLKSIQCIELQLTAFFDLSCAKLLQVSEGSSFKESTTVVCWWNLTLWMP